MRTASLRRASRTCSQNGPVPRRKRAAGALERAGRGHVRALVRQLSRQARAIGQGGGPAHGGIVYLVLPLLTVAERGYAVLLSACLELLAHVVARAGENNYTLLHVMRERVPSRSPRNLHPPTARRALALAQWRLPREEELRQGSEAGRRTLGSGADRQCGRLLRCLRLPTRLIT